MLALERQLHFRDEEPLCRLNAAREALQEVETELAEWKMLGEPATLHLNLLRGIPARLTREQLIHLLGSNSPESELRMAELAMLIKQLVSRLKQLDASSDLPRKGVDYLQRHGLAGSPLRTGATGESA